MNYTLFIYTLGSFVIGVNRVLGRFGVVSPMFGVSTGGVGGTGQPYITSVGVVVGDESTNVGFGLVFVRKGRFFFFDDRYIGGLRFGRSSGFLVSSSDSSVLF